MAILPQWAQEGGVGKVLERLADPALREEMKKNRRPMWQLVAAERWSDIMLLHSEQNPDLVGETFADIARQRNTDPYNAVFDLLLEEGEGMQRMLWTSHIFRDTDLELCLEHADCAVASDTMALAPYGALENQLGSLSGYGWAARFLQHFVRERCVLPLAAGIRRLTSLPAERLAIKDRGRLRPGLRADIAVFDADRVASRCTVTEPRLYPSGFEHVMVNGKLALRDGTRTDHDGGVVLRGRG
jgi:N-acyl-D-aspartate/D-glutamate deacylase